MQVLVRLARYCFPSGATNSRPRLVVTFCSLVRTTLSRQSTSICMWLARIHSVGITHFLSFSASFWMAGVSSLGAGAATVFPRFCHSGMVIITRKITSPAMTLLRSKSFFSTFGRSAKNPNSFL